MLLLIRILGPNSQTLVGSVTNVQIMGEQGQGLISGTPIVVKPASVSNSSSVENKASQFNSTPLSNLVTTHSQVVPILPQPIPLPTLGYFGINSLISNPSIPIPVPAPGKKIQPLIRPAPAKPVLPPPPPPALFPVLNLSNLPTMSQMIPK